MIKLAIVGASSTGKTTLVERLEKQFKQNSKIIFVHESARQFFNENQVDSPFDFVNQEKILELALLNEKLAQDVNPKIMVTDTSALEVIFYTKVQGNDDGADRLLRRLEDYIPTYTKFLLMNPNDVKYENDEVRRETEETRNKIHNLLVEFYSKRHLVFELIRGTIPERQKKLADIINSYLNL